MSPELSDLENPIIDVETTYHALYAMAENSVKDHEMQRVLYFLAMSLCHTHSTLRERYEAVLATERENAPAPLHGV